MKESIYQLVKLQDKDNEIRTLKSKLIQIPKEIDALEKEIAVEKENLKHAEGLLKTGAQQQRKAESTLSSTEEALSKYQEQLMSVKSNDEYKAMQKQIVVTKKQISDVETEILQGLDILEDFTQEKMNRQKELNEGQAKVTIMAAKLNEEKSTLETELLSQQQERDNILGFVPEELLNEYNKIADNRSGIAVAKAVEERCLACMVRIRPQIFLEVKSGQTIHHCRSCSRILYYIKEETETATS